MISIIGDVYTATCLTENEYEPYNMAVLYDAVLHDYWDDLLMTL
jgi:hypothetical protein